MKPLRITVFPGDGIGPEVTTAALTVLAATGIEFDFDQRMLDGMNGCLSKAAVQAFEYTHLAIKGPTATPSGEGRRSLNVQLRERFKLFANVRPVQSMDGVRTRFSDVPINMVIIRENTEDFYVGSETRLPDGLGAVGHAPFSYKGCERIARFAFDYAKKNNRKKVTIGHKANIAKATHGLFLATAMGVAREYPDIAVEDMIFDNCAMQMVTRPERFDVLLLPNMFGDIASDLAAGLVGGLGFAAGLNVGENGYALAEAVHGTAPDIAGKDLANPTSLILSSAMLLAHIGKRKEARVIRHAVYRTLLIGRDVTADAKSVLQPVGTQQYAAAVAKWVETYMKEC